MELLRKTAERHSAVAVAYSDGKDARVVLDLAMKAGFKRVEAYYMYLVPELDVIKKGLAEAEARYPGLRVHWLPSMSSWNAVRHGIYRDPISDVSGFPEFDLRDIYNIVMNDLGCSLVMTGEKASDSMRRRLLMKRGMNSWHEVMWPIKDWNTHDVVAYLTMRKIPVPEQIGAGATSGVTLTTRSLLHLHKHYPEDFKRVLEYYPYAEAAIWRARFYGIES